MLLMGNLIIMIIKFNDYHDYRDNHDNQLILAIQSGSPGQSETLADGWLPIADT